MAVLALSCGIAGRIGVGATADLQWPGGPDFTRDIAAAQSIASPEPLQDPFYRHERLWYNPLTPAVVATIASVTREPIHTVYARAGAYLNLLAPIAFFGMLWQLFGPRVAMFGVAGFLFFVPQDGNAILCARYSPWLMPVHFVQALFYGGVTALHRAARTRSFQAFALAGGFGGLAFLGHTAPFVLLLVLAGEVCIGLARQSPRRAFVCVALYVGTAALVSAVFWLPLLWRYHMHVVNPLPMVWNTPELSLESAGAFLRSRPLWSFTTIAIGAGAWRLLQLVAARTEESAGARLVLTIAAATALGVSYSYGLEYLRLHGREWPALVPGFHFMYYLGAVASICFALACHWAVERAIAWRPRLLSAWVPLLVTVLLIVAVAKRTPSYAARPDVVDMRAGSLQMFSDASLRSMFDWVSRTGSRDDVFAADDALSQHVIATAGRKVVAVGSHFSNPYVSWDQRRGDRDAMLDALRRADCLAFRALALRYGVRYAAGDLSAGAGTWSACRLSAVWQSGTWVIYRANE